jgi:hypothetical protein
VKARPRSVENKVAEILSGHFQKVKMAPVARVPVTGRQGPDISINQAGIAVDVKSRLEVPKTLWRQMKKKKVAAFGPLVAVRLKDFLALLEDLPISEAGQLPKTVRLYHDHMAAWCNGTTIPVVVLHRPEMWVHNALVMMKVSDLGIFRSRFTVEGENGTTIEG